MGLKGFIGDIVDSTLDSAKQSSIDLIVNSSAHMLNYSKRGGQLKFISPRGYDNVYVYAAKRTMMQLAFAKINDLYPQYVRQMDFNKAEDAYNANQGKQRTTIIDQNESADTALLDRQKANISYRGKLVPEALIIWVSNSETKKNITIKTYWDKIKQLSNEREKQNDKFDANTSLNVPAEENDVFYDLGAKVQAKSSNNVILTKVQGRDFSRKELISNGDITFTVTGKIVSNYPDVYPYNMVSKFVRLMQHHGVINVSNLMFGQFNVTKIIIKDFSLDQRVGFKNEQPYSFTCVGVEPDEFVNVVKDTIDIDNIKISKMKKPGWTDQLLKQLKSAAANQASQMLEQLTANTI